MAIGAVEEAISAAELAREAAANAVDALHDANLRQRAVAFREMHDELDDLTSRMVAQREALVGVLGGGLRW